MALITLQIEKLNSKGFGLGRHNGKIYFVPYALPGDEVQINESTDSSTYAETPIVKIIKQSPDRQKPKCPVFFKCGGCNLQHLSYEQQLVQKQIMVVDALKKVKIDFEVSPTRAAKKNWNYRNRVQVHINKKGQLGFYASQSHEVVEFEECAVAEPEVNEQIKELKSLNQKGPKTIEVRSESGLGFTQVHTAQNKVLVELVLSLLSLKQKDIVADVYCGGGNFTFELAQQALRVIGFEKDPQALQVAQQRSLKAKIQNIQWRQGEASRLLYQCVQEKLAFDAMLLDPPRKGLESASKFIPQLKPKKIVLVSCDLQALGTDAKFLIDSGYQLKQVIPVDMFPQTHHVEVVSFFVSE